MAIFVITLYMDRMVMDISDSIPLMEIQMVEQVGWMFMRIGTATATVASLIVWLYSVGELHLLLYGSTVLVSCRISYCVALQCW